MIKLKTSIETIRYQSEKPDKNGKYYLIFTVLANSIENKEIQSKIKKYHYGMRNRHLVVITTKTKDLVGKNQSIEIEISEDNIANISYNEKYYNYIIEVNNITAIEDMTISGFERFIVSNFNGIGDKASKNISKALVSCGATEENILQLFKDFVINGNEEFFNLLPKRTITSLNKKVKEQLINTKEQEEDNIVLSEVEKIFCSKYNIGYNFLLKLKKQYIKSLNIRNKSSVKDANILSQLKLTPYFLALDDKIKGFGFKSIDDKVKRILGNDFILDNSFKMQRFLGYLQFVLLKSEESGHLYLTYEDIYKEFLEYNKKEPDKNLHFEIDKDLFFFKERIIIYISELSKKDVLNPYFYNEDLVSTYSNYFLEKNTAKLLHQINNNTISVDKDLISKRLEKLEKKKNLFLSKEQKEAVLHSIVNPVSIITGGPGTGKTTISQMLIDLLISLGKKVKVLAPTGTAAKKISSVIGLEAMTIHRGLEFKGYFTRNYKNPLEEDVIIVDESSMIDSNLAKKLLEASINSQIVFIGDVNQLPSVGAGDFLRDIISSEKFAVSNLTKIFRQAEGNPIISFAYKVNDGKPLADFFQWFTTKEDVREKFSILSKSIYKRKINEELNKDWLNNMMIDTQKIGLREYILSKSLMDVQILVANNRSNGLINTYLQEKINGEEEFIYETNFKVNDKVIQIKNNYKLEIFNGTIGTIVDYDKVKEILFVDIGDIIVEIDRNTAKREMQLCYSMTIHKSQGQEFNTVIMLINDFMLNSRELIYTGATRAKENLKVITNPMLLQSGISKSNKQGSSNFRNTRLIEFLN